MADNIKVAVRIRPLIRREISSQCESHWIAKANNIYQLDPESKRVSQYSFDNVFDPTQGNTEVYNVVGKPIVYSAMQGFNGTIFGYGQTSSGKTHTIMGDKSELGIIPLVICDIYEYIENSPGRVFCVRVSYLEIYNETVTDLLGGESKLKIHENADGSIYLDNLKEQVISSPSDFAAALDLGEGRRRFGETNMNERSSRSHTIFRIIIESREEIMSVNEDLGENQGVVVVSQLNIVDLAGSERVGQTGASGDRLKEGCAINKSLFMLSQVISRLSDGDGQFVNFRDSKLTRILQNSLGGNSKTAIICTVTPVAIDETHSTLKFASRAKTIKNKPVKNEVLTDDAMLKRYQRQIQDLKSQVQQLTDASHVQVLQAEKAEIEIQLKEKEEKIQQLSKLLCFSSKASVLAIESVPSDKRVQIRNRRETWCIGPRNQLPCTPQGLRHVFSKATWANDEPRPSLGEKYLILEEEAEVLEDPSSSPPTGQLTTRNFCEQSAQTDELPLYASAFRSYNEVGTTTDSDLLNEGLEEMKVRKHLITIRFLEEEVSRYKKQVEQLENDLVDTKKMLELSVDESVRGEIIRICTENESLKTQLDFVRLQLASRSPRSLGSNKPPSFDEEVEAEKISSTPINGQRLNTPLNHSGTCRELFSGSDVSCQADLLTRPLMEEPTMTSSNEVREDTFTELTQISNLCEQLMCEKDELQQSLVAQKMEIKCLSRKIRLAMAQLKDSEESRQALLKTFKEENDHLVEFHQNEIRILAEEIDDLIKQKKVWVIPSFEYLSDGVDKPLLFHKESELDQSKIHCKCPSILFDDLCPTGQLIDITGCCDSPAESVTTITKTAPEPSFLTLVDISVQCCPNVKTADCQYDEIHCESEGMEFLKRQIDLAELEKKCDSQAKQIIELKGEINKANALLSTTLDEKTASQNRISELLANKKTLEKLCDEADEELMRETNKVFNMRQDIEKLKIASEREIQSKETQILALQSEIEILKKSCSTVDSDEIKRELTRRDMTVLNLQRQLAVAEKNQLAKCSSLQSQIKSLQDKVSSLKQEIRSQQERERDDTVSLSLKKPGSEASGVVCDSVTGSGIMDEYKIFSLETIRYRLEKELVAVKRELVDCQKEREDLRRKFTAIVQQNVMPSTEKKKCHLQEVSNLAELVPDTQTDRNYDEKSANQSRQKRLFEDPRSAVVSSRKKENLPPVDCNQQ